jgi:glutamate-5-semialdehyde dehydrogenase
VGNTHIFFGPAPEGEMETSSGEYAKKADSAASTLAATPTIIKNRAILEMALLLDRNRDEIARRNDFDIESARKEGVSRKLVDRLVFGQDRIDSRIRALEAIEGLDDPVGGISGMRKMPGGLVVGRMVVPIGVILVVFESRPHVTVNAGALCIKSGNASILRGGSEVIETNTYLGELWGKALEQAGLPEECVQVIPSTDREVVTELLTMDEYINLVIPRGGEGLIKAVLDVSRVPVIKHLYGICHVFVDESAEIETALRVCLDSKVFAPEVCNAAETFLVAEGAAAEVLPLLCGLMSENGVEVRGCPETRKIVSWVERASESDWSTEYLDLIVSVKVVAGVEEAVGHINEYGSGHTESIVSGDFENIRAFIDGADSGVLLVNASTMFNDGSELGMGAEIGISTDRIHARGPMGVEDLTIYKTLAFGNGDCMGEARR